MTEDTISRLKSQDDHEPLPRTERDLLASEDRRLREFQRSRDRELYKARLRVLERETVRSRSRSRSPVITPKPSVDRRRSRSRDRSLSRERERRDRERELELEEEAHERRKLEKRLREKEAAYRERLKAWESRESKKHREYRKERDRDLQKKDDEEKEARRLKEFLEDYDDERDDMKFYKGSALSRRMKEREKETELDDRDRVREKEELEEIKRRLHDEGHPDVEAEIFKLERQRNEHLRPKPVKIERVEPSQPKKRKEKSPIPVEVKQEPPTIDAEDTKPPQIVVPEPEETNKKTSSSDMFARDSPVRDAVITEKQEPPAASAVPDIVKQENTASPTEMLNMKRKKLTVVDVFNQEDDDDSGLKKRKLVPLDYNEEEKESKKPKTIEEKRAHIKTLIERIPTAKEELFSYPLDWAIVDTNLMDKRIKPWVNKKIIEYIGEEEPTLTEFICQKVVSKSSPQNILNDVAMVLDEEAEVFIVKMWRLLIYETEAKKAGLVK